MTVFSTIIFIHLVMIPRAYFPPASFSFTTAWYGSPQTPHLPPFFIWFYQGRQINERMVHFKENNCFLKGTWRKIFQTFWKCCGRGSPLYMSNSAKVAFILFLSTFRTTCSCKHVSSYTKLSIKYVRLVPRNSTRCRCNWPEWCLCME